MIVHKLLLKIKNKNSISMVTPALVLFGVGLTTSNLDSYTFIPGSCSVKPQSDLTASGAVGDKGLAQGHLNVAHEKGVNAASHFPHLDLSNWSRGLKQRPVTILSIHQCPCLERN